MTERADILAVDDNSDVLTLLVRILSKEGYGVRGVDSGEAALEAVAENPPDLILLDMCMRGISGIEVCRQLKANQDHRHIPIILLSGFANVAEWVEGLRLGAADYIVKPFEREELRTRVRTHLALHRANASLEQHANLLRRTNERLQAEITQKHQVENELRKSLDQAEHAREAMLRALEDQRHAAEELRQSEEKFRELFEASCDGIVILEPPNWSFSSANPAALGMFGIPITDLAMSVGPLDLSPEIQPDGRPSVEIAKEKIAIALRDGTASFEWTHTRTNGTDFVATVRLSRMGKADSPRLQGTIRDVSEQKRLESELEHSRKLEAVGQLASGIAHEINTPAQYVGDGLQFLKEAFTGYRRLLTHYEGSTKNPSEPNANTAALVSQIREVERDVDLAYLDENVPSALDRCIDGISRIATIVRAMKEFAHPDQREMVAADLNHALQNTLTIARNEYKYVADVETHWGELPQVFCHVGDINQVFLNLIVNAAHAIEDVVKASGARGVIRVVTQREGDWVQIDISDTGAGIPNPIRGRIFEPFFTTKEIGRGSGQGLAIAHSIVTVKHRGTLTFTTVVGLGSTFTIRLPIQG